MATNSRKGFELHEILRGGILRKFHTSRRFSRRRVVRNWSAGRPVSAVTDGVSTNLLAYDAFGSVTNETQNGVAIERTYDGCGRLVAMNGATYDYSAFGRTLVAAGFLRNRNPFRFSSEYVDDATGLSYYNWRHYDPVNGRWLSEDPIGEEGGVNLYGFVGNASVDSCDALGLLRSGGKYTFDEKNCMLNVELSWWVSYINKTGLKKWEKEDVRLWESKAKNVVNNYFKNLKLKCYPENSGCCVCRNGVSVNFDLKIVRKGEKPGTRVDYHPKVITDGRFRSETIPGRREANLDIDDVYPQPKGAREKQIPIIHEVGHQLGLPHPGGWGNNEKDYDADIESLMGGGMTMREADFSIIFCSKINVRDRQKGKDCMRWTAK